jgi:hypothetical protein
LAPFGFFKKKDKAVVEKDAREEKSGGEGQAAAVAAAQGRAQAAMPAGDQLSIEEAQALLQRIDDSMSQAVAVRMVPMRQAAAASLAELAAIAGDMEREKVKLEELEKRFGSTVENSKRTLVSALRRESSSELPEIKTAADAKKFRERLESAMNRLGEVSGSHSKMVNYFMKKHADRMRDEFASLQDILKEAKAALAGFEQERAPVVKCQAMLNTAAQKLASIRADESSAQAVASRLETLRGELARSRDELAALRASAEFAAAVADAQRKEQAEKKVHEFQSRISEMFSHVSRALAKYSYGVSKETERRLQVMSEEPWRVFYDSDQESAGQYLSLLAEVEKSVASGKIQLKDADRVAQHLRAIQSSFADLCRQAAEVSAEADAARRAAAAAGPARRADELQEAIARYEEQVARDEQALEQQKRQAAEKRAEVDALLWQASDALAAVVAASEGGERKRYSIVASAGAVSQR